MASSSIKINTYGGISMTAREQYWMGKCNDLIEQVDKMMQEGTADKKELWFMNAYNEYLESLLRFNNLQLPNSDNATELMPGVFKAKRIVQICSRIPGYELDKNHINWFIFNGLYIVTDVYFIDEDMYCDKKCPIYNERSRHINIPEKISAYINNNTAILNSVHTVIFEEDSKIYKYKAFLADRQILRGYCQYNTNWQYPYIREMCDGDIR